MGKIAPIALGLAFILTGCSKFNDGVHAFYGGEFANAESLLRGYAEKAAKKTPVVHLKKAPPEVFERELAAATTKLFLGWQAYAGSQFGLGQIEKGCESTRLALRPIRVKVSGGPDENRDPRVGDYWQADVRTLRSWWLTIPCE